MADLVSTFRVASQHRMPTPESILWHSLPVDLRSQIQTELTQLLSEVLH